MAKDITVEDVFKLVWKDHWDCERFNSSGHSAEVKYNYHKRIEVDFGSKKLASVTVLDVRKWHAKHKEHPVAANRALEVLSRIFEYAAQNELNELGANPCRGVKSYTERMRRRYATEIEIKKIGEALYSLQEKYPVQILFLLALVYSGARPRFIIRAKWEDLTPLENGFGALMFAGKATAETGLDDAVIFPPHIMRLMSNLPKRKDGLIFGIKMPRAIWIKVREAAGCPDLWARDLRRTFATVGMSNGVKMEVISELLNHKTTQTTRRYAKLNNRARIDAVREISGKIDELFDPKLKVVGE